MQKVRKMLASLLSLIEPDAYMQKLTHFTVSKNRHNKIPVGATWGHRPTTFWPWGRSPPSPPWSRRLWEI